MVNRPKYKGPFTIDKGNGDHMHEVCIPQKIPRAWEQHEEEVDTKIIARE